jgi:hypothetical protein
MKLYSALLKLLQAYRDDNINNSSTQKQTHLKPSLRSQQDHASDYEPL